MYIYKKCVSKYVDASCAGLRRGRRVHGNASRYQLDANLQKNRKLLDTFDLVHGTRRALKDRKIDTLGWLSYSGTGLFSNHGEKSINLSFIMVLLRQKVLKYGTPKPRESCYHSLHCCNGGYVKVQGLSETSCGLGVANGCGVYGLP